MTQRIGVALSGGADSAVAASLLLSQGYHVHGFHLRLTRSREAEAQEALAAKVAQSLGLPLQVVDAIACFESRVIRPFCAAYAAGCTPNPCIRCNREIKFGLLLETARGHGMDSLATGHYARVTARGGAVHLERGADPWADQSYFLYALDPSALPYLTMPLGELSRTQVRTMARESVLPTGRSSQDICFIAGRDYRAFISARVSAAPGDIVSLDGRVLGQHNGLPGYTVGQRHRLGVALGVPAYVVRLDTARSAVVVGTAADLLASEARLHQVHWLTRPAGERFEVQARTRYRGRLAAAEVSTAGDRALVRFHEPQRALAPGQSVVFYHGETVLGGGVITEETMRAHDAEADRSTDR